MPAFWETESFKLAEKKWDQILEQSGFHDIERNRRGLKSDRAKISKLDFEQRTEQRREYCRLITSKIYGSDSIIPWELDYLDLIVMAMLGDGVPIGVIADRNKIHRQTVRFIIRRCEHFWGIRYWSKKDRNLKDE